MTHKEEAHELIKKFRPFANGHENDDMFRPSTEKLNAKACALVAVQFAEKVLTEYGKETDELQNMDRFFAYLEKLTNEIKAN